MLETVFKLTYSESIWGCMAFTEEFKEGAKQGFYTCYSFLLIVSIIVSGCRMLSLPFPYLAVELSPCTVFPVILALKPNLYANK